MAVQNDVTVQNDVAVQNKGIAAQPVVDTAAEPLYLPAGSSRRQSKPPTPLRDHSAPLRFADAAVPLLVTALFFLCSSPFCRYSFSLVCPSLSSFSPYFSMLL